MAKKESTVYECESFKMDIIFKDDNNLVDSKHTYFAFNTGNGNWIVHTKDHTTGEIKEVTLNKDFIDELISRSKK
jgi:ribulose 1,5-bisphosphate carboxylase large subunit-like protein